MITTSIPVLETDRLRLRAHGPEDLETMQQMWSDPTFVRYVGAQVSDRGESWGRMLKMNGLWSLAGFGYWAVEERATGRYIAQTGFADFKRDVVPAAPTSPEAGWAVHPAAAGQGYATEAMRAALGWLVSAGWQQAHALIHPDNEPSTRIARKLGFQEGPDGLLGDEPTRLWLWDSRDASSR